MTLHRFARAVSALTLIGLVALAGCDLTSAGVSEQIANVQTIQALTPSPTLSPTVTDTPEASPTLTPTQGPSPTATITPPPSATPLPPTPTPNPALAGFSFCDQRAGPVDGLFSARLTELAASGTPAYEQVVMRFELAEGSAPLGATASCLGPEDVASADPESAGPYAVRVSLPGWIRDERYSSSPISQTLSFTGTRTITGARVIPADTPDAGVTLLIGLSQPLPFRLTVERNPTRVVIAVARSSPIVASSDQLRVPAGGGKPDLSAPLFALYDGDIWRVEAGDGDDSPGLTPGLAGATNLTGSPETETHLAVSPDGKSVAFCRAAPGVDPADAQLPVPSTLWLMDADGKNPRAIAQVGVSCADPAFSPDGATLAFAVDETGAMPIQRVIYSVPAAGGQPRRLSEGVDEWSRFAPQWLEGGDLVFAAASQDGRSTLLLRRASGETVDIGAPVLVRDNAAPPYAGFGRPLAARDGSRFAAEVLRGDAPGADLAIFDADGDVLEVIGAQRVVPPPTPTATPSPTRTPRPTGTAATPAGTGTAATPAGTGTAATPAGTRTAASAGAAATPAGTGTAATPAGTRTAASAGAAATPAGTGTAATPAGTVTATVARTATATPTAPARLTATRTPTATAELTATAALSVTATLTPTPEPEPPAEATRTGPYWTRPVAWDSQGRLLYLSTLCASEAAQDYQLSRWDGAQRSELMAAGQTLGGIGPATIAGDGLAYVLSEQGPAGPRGPTAIATRGPTALWLWDLASGARGELLSAERGVAALEH